MGHQKASSSRFEVNWVLLGFYDDGSRTSKKGDINGTYLPVLSNMAGNFGANENV